MFSETALVDAVIMDLEASVALPAHQSWRYLDPPYVAADRGALLAVYVRATDLSIISTIEDYEALTELHVTWFQPHTRGTETGGIGNQEAARSALDVSEAVITHLLGYGDAVPGIVTQSEGTVTEARYGLVEGGVWMLDVTLRVRRWT